MIKAVIIGQSHTVCIADALSDLDLEGISVVRLRSGDKLNDPNAVTIDQAVQFIRDLPGGTYHNILGLVRPEVEFDFLLNSSDDVSVGTQLIPHKVFVSAFDQHLETETGVKKIKAAAVGQVHVLSAPPPKQDNEFMMQKLLAKWNKPYRGQDIAASGLNSASLRLKLWLLECERLKKWSEGLKMKYVPAPSACLNNDGFLAESYFAADATHANSKYGALVLGLVASIVDQRHGND
jgi:hypothetical protein